MLFQLPADWVAVCNASWGLVCVALDTTLFVFAENCSTLQLQLTMQHTVDTVRHYSAALSGYGETLLCSTQ